MDTEQPGDQAALKDKIVLQGLKGPVLEAQKLHILLDVITRLSNKGR